MSGVNGPVEIPHPDAGTGPLIELAAEENTVFAFDPIRRIVPTTITKITANITAYSAMSWPLSSVQNLEIRSVMEVPPYEFSCTAGALTLGGEPDQATAANRTT